MQNNILGNFSLAIGVLTATTIFGAVLCTVVGLRQGWLAAAGTPLLVCAGTTVFLALVGILLGVIALFNKGQPRSAAIAGLLLCVLALCMFFATLARLRGG
jgi:hypothetical protein